MRGDRAPRRDELRPAEARGRPAGLPGAAKRARRERAGNASRASIGGSTGLRTMLGNVSEATGGRERIVLYTAQMRDGSLFYMIGVSPEAEFGTYQQVINKVASSVQFLR